MKSVFITALKNDGVYRLYINGKSVGVIQDLKLGLNEEVESLSLQVALDEDVSVGVSNGKYKEEGN